MILASDFKIGNAAVIANDSESHASAASNGPVLPFPDECQVWWKFSERNLLHCHSDKQKPPQTKYHGMKTRPPKQKTPST
jgi:hypothetical protein